jgi:hypothetical protein
VVIPSRRLSQSQTQVFLDTQNPLSKSFKSDRWHRVGQRVGYVSAGTLDGDRQAQGHKLAIGAHRRGLRYAGGLLISNGWQLAARGSRPRPNLGS